MSSEDLLREIGEEISLCERCGLCKNRKNAVPGAGPANAEILFIGEGPGHHENEQGLPFVGNAGKFLSSMLQAAGYDRDSVFITNVVKCRPPSNRDPLPEELIACAEYLERQIEVITPIIIVTLGRFSMARYYENARISTIHGKPKWAAGRLIIPMFHPAAALHQPALRKTVEEDFSLLPHWIEKVKEKKKKEALLPVQSSQEEDGGQPEQLSLFG
ncbi:MAG: uracil-DNA glycosylase [Anaerolineaceae bacterium]|nr:uracil-DNA glycosylase [Anaerolineaceae bacterium]